MEDFVVKSLAISPYVGTFAANNTYTNLLTTFGPYTSVFPPQGNYAPNAVIPDTPEQWLRRRVKEVCELVAA